jgi:DnaJ-class molecular chaperone
VSAANSAGRPVPVGEPAAGPQSATNVCPDCAGSGVLKDARCSRCAGSGTVTEIVGDA